MKTHVRRNGGRIEILTVALIVGLVAANLPARAQEEAGDPAASVTDGIESYRTGDYERAARLLSSVRGVAPGHSPAALYLGLTYLRLGETGKAIDAWEDYAQMDPSTTLEVEEDLPAQVRRHLTSLLKEESHRLAEEAIRQEQTLPPGAPNTVAITYYRNLGSSNLDPLQKGLTALLIDDVSKVAELNVVERERLQALLEELELGTTGLVEEGTAPEVGRLLGAGKVAAGSYADFQDDMEVSSAVADTASAAVVATQTTGGRIDQFFELEKALALRLLEDLGYSQETLASQGVLDDIRTPQTKSLAAMTAFSRGLDLKDQENYPAAREQFERALKEDPDFELARRELLALPFFVLSTDEIIAAVESSAPSASMAAAALSGTGSGPPKRLGGLLGTKTAVGAGLLTAVGVGTGAYLLVDDDDEAFMSPDGSPAGP